MINIGIIGTAGRARVPTVEEWEAMLSAARWTVSLKRLVAPGEPITLVSGGAAWSDHIAVKLFLNGDVDGLVLHLPGNRRDQDVAAYYSKPFLEVTGCDRLNDISLARTMPGYYENVAGTFKERNLRVAQGSTDLLVAFTYGPGGRPADGGTSHTWANHSHLYPEVPRMHFSIQNLSTGNVTKKGGDKQMTLWTEHVQGCMALAEGMLKKGEKAKSNPIVRCDNCRYAARLPNEYGTFDRCTSPLGKGIVKYAIDDYTNSEARELNSPYEGKMELAKWVEGQEHDLLKWSNRDNPKFEVDDIRSELKDAINAEIYVSRALYLYGPANKADGEVEEDFIWHLNPDRCWRHQYNWTAMSKKGEPTPALAVLHIGRDVIYEDGKRFHLKMKKGVKYWRDVLGIPITKEVKFRNGEVKTAYFPLSLVVNPVTGTMNWDNVIDWDRYQKIKEYWYEKTNYQVQAHQIRQIAMAQFIHETGQKIWGLFQHSKGGRKGFYNLAALPDTKEWLYQHGVSFDRKTNAEDIFNLYKKESKRLRLLEQGCPELGEPPAGDYVAVLDKLNAVTGKGTIITEEVQSTYNKMYWVRNMKAYEFNAMSIEDRMKFISCKCDVPCADVVVDLEKLLTEEYSEIYADMGCDRPREMAKHEEDLLPGYMGYDVDDSAALHAMYIKFGLSNPREDKRYCNICKSVLAPDNKGTICTSHVKAIEARMEANRKK